MQYNVIQSIYTCWCSLRNTAKVYVHSNKTFLLLTLEFLSPINISNFDAMIKPLKVFHALNVGLHWGNYYRFYRQCLACIGVEDRDWPPGQSLETKVLRNMLRPSRSSTMNSCSATGWDAIIFNSSLFMLIPTPIKKPKIKECNSCAESSDDHYL